MKEAEAFDRAASMLCAPLASALTSLPAAKRRTAQEIRLRLDKPLAVSIGSQTLFVCRNGDAVFTPERAMICTRSHIYESFRRLCGYSVYSRQSEIRNGFVTSQGCRVGLCGTAAVKNGEISSVSDITSLNLRIARSIAGASHALLKKLLPLSGGLLIAGAPGSGKTTILRDLARTLSVGELCPVMRVAVIDERGELSGAAGESGTGLCDMLIGYPKSEGIMQAIRALSPQVIICDEIGGEQDCRAIAAGANAGVLIIASIHAGSFSELMRREQTSALLRTGAFSSAAVLFGSDRAGEIREIRSVRGGALDVCA